ncbi:MAG: hypothetical protein M1324_01875 [Patescibacteria group bacterium]|nr:hypothetical protein [Patescibacteria group bacterium]
MADIPRKLSDKAEVVRIKKDNSSKNLKDRLPKVMFEGFDIWNGSSVDDYVKLQDKKQLTQTEKRKMEELRMRIFKENGLQNGMLAGGLDHGEFLGVLMTTRKSIVDEYDCKTPLELMIVDRIVANYWKAMRCNSIFNRFTASKDGRFSFDQLKVNILKELDKCSEKADRQLNADIILLKELKQPKLNVKISANNAYVANNQQVINKREENDHPNEIIKAK